MAKYKSVGSISPVSSHLIGSGSSAPKGMTSANSFPTREKESWKTPTAFITEDSSRSYHYYEHQQTSLPRTRPTLTPLDEDA